MTDPHRITVSLTKEQSELVNGLVKGKFFETKSQVVRFGLELINDAIKQGLKVEIK